MRCVASTLLELAFWQGNENDGRRRRSVRKTPRHRSKRSVFQQSNWNVDCPKWEDVVIGLFDEVNCFRSVFRPRKMGAFSSCHGGEARAKRSRIETRTTNEKSVRNGYVRRQVLFVAHKIMTSYFLIGTSRDSGS
jgi:hypothetical protein